MTIRMGCLVHFNPSVAVMVVEISWEFSLEPQYRKYMALKLTGETSPHIVDSLKFSYLLSWATVTRMKTKGATEKYRDGERSLCHTGDAYDGRKLLSFLQTGTPLSPL